MRLGSSAPIGGTIQTELANPVRDFFGGHPVPPPQPITTDSLIIRLRSESDIVSIDGGLDDATLDEIRFDIHMRKEFDYELRDIEFGLYSDILGIGVRNGVEMNLKTIVDFRVTFGLRLAPSLNVEQAFFVSELDLDVSFNVDTILHPFEIGIGILHASVPTATINGDLRIHVGQRDPNVLERILLSELNSEDVVDLTESRIDSNLFDASFDVTASAGRWRVSGSTVLVMVGNLIGIDPAVTFSADFDELLLFNRITPSEMVRGMEQFGAWLTSFSASDLFAVDIPFTSSASVASVYDVGRGLNGYLGSMRDTTAL